MTVTVSHSVFIQDRVPGTGADFTSRTAGFSVAQTLKRGAMGTGRAFLTLYNNDGALTPNAGGTYSTFNWFAKYVIISITTTDGSSTAGGAIFYGMTTDFEVTDDGTNSTVNLTFDDMVTVAGRSPTYDGLGTTTTSQRVVGAIERILNGDAGAGIPPVSMPNFGETDPGFQAYEVSQYDITTTYTVNHDGTPAGQQLNTQIMPAGPNFAWPTRISNITNDPAFEINVVERSLNRNRVIDGSAKTHPRPQVLTANPTGTELPFTEVQAGWNNDDMRNEADVTGQHSGATEQTVTNQTSINSYGVSSVTLGNCSANSDADALDIAGRWARQFDAPVYAARRVTIKASNVAKRCDDAAYQTFGDLFEVRTGLWNTCTVTYTPTGASTPVTDNTLIFGRTIRATAEDTTITLDLVPAANYQYFELDSAVLGVLDENRLG
jgi:hypothetical protein